MIKIIHTLSQNNSQSTPKMERSVNYVENFGAECYLLKIGCNESSFIKYQGCQCNLPYFLLYLPKQQTTLRIKPVHFPFAHKLNKIPKVKKPINFMQPSLNPTHSMDYHTKRAEPISSSSFLHQLVDVVPCKRCFQPFLLSHVTWMLWLLIY